MGRLFWKFFFFFWLAQLITSIGVGAAMWLLRPEHAPPRYAPPSGFERGPPPPAVYPGGAQSPPPPPSPEMRGEPGPAPMPPQMRSLMSPLMPPLMPIVAGSLVSLLFAALLAWYFASPIRSLRAAFRALAGGRLDTRVGVAMRGRNDELADLGNDFDLMAERLQGLLDTQRRLLHDVSHELRSPLARLQAAAGLLRQQPERGGEFIARIERDTARMDKLVGELLTLARLDAGTVGDLDEVIDLGEIIGDVADDARFEADAKGCAIEVAGDLHVIVRGSRELIQRALENVLRNAVRHSPAGGAINIAVSLDAATGLLRVAVGDQGPGVFEGDLKAIFSPFFRSGAADAFSGYGLGLAIARRVALAHGGSICAANRPAGGLLVTLSLPGQLSPPS